MAVSRPVHDKLIIKVVTFTVHHQRRPHGKLVLKVVIYEQLTIREGLARVGGIGETAEAWATKVIVLEDAQSLRGGFGGQYTFQIICCHKKIVIPMREHNGGRMSWSGKRISHV